MTPACDTFINIPELVACLAPFLTRHDLVQLSSVCCRFNTICAPLLWQSLDLQDNGLLSRLHASPEAVQALKRNAHLVRIITWRPNFSWYYLQAVWNYIHDHDIDAPLPPQHQSISTDALSHIMWGGIGGIVVPLPSTVALPPFLELSRLQVCLTSLPSDVRLPDNRGGYNSEFHIHRMLWLVRLNTTLTYLDLTELTLRPSRVIRDVARTISLLHCLQTLRLKTHPNRSLTRQDFDTLFFSCPGSLVEFKIAYLISGTTSAYKLEPVETDWDFDQGPLQLRKDPLFQLKRFALSAISQDLAPVFRAVLEHCPALEALESPYLGELTDDMMFVLASLGEVCPSLSSLSFPEGCRPEHIYTILEALPSHRLKEFSSRGFRDPDPAPMMSAVARHSMTLQKIELINCIQFKSKAIQSVLTLCVALEVLTVTGPGSVRVCLMFADAIEHAWVCTRLRQLEIYVSIAIDGMSLGFIRDHSKGSWTEEQHRMWDDLGRLYTQIGSLTRLEIMDLRAVGRKVHVIDYDTDRVIFLPPSETCLPGLLALEDSSGTGQQIGYLSRLAGLTRLRELKGSVVWTQEDTKERIGEREVDWFVTHLPELEMASFESKEKKQDASALLRLLQARRPGLRICQN